MDASELHDSMLFFADAAVLNWDETNATDLAQQVRTSPSQGKGQSIVHVNMPRSCRWHGVSRLDMANPCKFRHHLEDRKAEQMEQIRLRIYQVHHPCTAITLSFISYL